ncbi:MAG TPA: Na/Pi symporter [Candidatus Paenalcaligenes intestinipullorum]|uniref:Na/Pi symporter n=1 Tax=Candidatus Paenalcaligenes intestinipullorum TaxID=2838718 RepID=A0A9D2RG22_9BURK|nr:Na/Pi symporter [Candidatus Paenalcaligenes intestinipullorum]
MSQTDTVSATPPPSSKWWQWLGVLALIYLLICAVGLIGTGFEEATGGRAKELFSFATNPYVGLVIGIVATALIQSSSTVTSLIVGMVAGGLPVAIAVPMVMGSNIGTTVTNTLVSLGHMRKKNEFRRAFAAATVHDFFNLLAVVIFLPLEIMFGLLEKSSAYVAHLLVGGSSLSMSGVNIVSSLTSPVVNAIEASVRLVPNSTASGVVLVLVGLALIFFSITYVGKLLRVLMVGKAKEVMHRAIGKGPFTGICSGTLITVFVQSSSTTTSLMVPLAGAGTFTLKQIYPFMLGANIGTTITALLAATAVSGPMEVPAMQIALVHVLYNFFSVALIYSLPFLRELPLRGADKLSRLASKKKWYAAVWIFGVFLLLPLLLIALTTLF